MEGKPPAFQFYAKEWLADTAYLTPAQQGCYIRLLAHQWVEGPLPDKADELRRRLALNARDFAGIWKVLAKHFPKNGHGTIANPRLEEVRKVQIKRAIARSLAGEKGAEGRWGNGK